MNIDLYSHSNLTAIQFYLSNMLLDIADMENKTTYELFLQEYLYDEYNLVMRELSR